MTILQLLADMAHAVEFGDAFEFNQLQQQANEMLLTSTESQQVTNIVATLEIALEHANA
jgi:hypothetical protein